MKNIKGYNQAQQPAYNQYAVQQPQQVQYVQQPQQPQVRYAQQQRQQVLQPVVVSNPRHMPRNPTTAMCTKCQANVQTETTLEAGLGTWAICCGIFLVGCQCGCCLIPFCIDDCKDVIHTCSRCGTEVGSRKIINM